jgi:hypothetical protein
MEWETVGTVGVDTGRLLITDPAYLDLWGYVSEPGSYSDTGLSDGMTGRDSAALTFPTGGEGAGVAVSTGYGDGLYPVQVSRTTDGRVAAVRVVFIGEDGERVSGTR